MKFNTKAILLKIIKYRIHHVLFWFFYFLLWVFLYKPVSDYQSAVESSLAIVVLHGSASYFNNYYLVPVFLRKREYLYYFASVLLTISFFCFIHISFLLWSDLVEESEKYQLMKTSFFFNDAISISYTVALTTTLMFFKQWFEKEKLTDKLQKLNAETELKFLKSQINPHFLFNSLNSVYALTLSKSSDAPGVVIKLSEILRYILYEGGEKTVGLKREIEYLENYLELEKIRFGKRLTISLSLEGDPSGKEIAPMIFLPFVENSFKHGVNSTIGEAFIHIVIQVHSQELFFRIENNLPPNKSEYSQNYVGGIGIENVKKRLQLMYPGKYKLYMQEEEDRFVVELMLQF